MIYLIKRGLEKLRTKITPSEGEPIVSTDTSCMYIGDGKTPGGKLVIGAITFITDVKMLHALEETVTGVFLIDTDNTFVCAYTRSSEDRHAWSKVNIKDISVVNRLNISQLEL